MSNVNKTIIAIMLSALLSSCALGPDYVRPTLDIPAAFKESWKPAEPSEISMTEKWWESFGDAALNQLHDELERNNQNIRVAEAQYRQTRAALDVAQAGFFPSVSASAGATRGRTGTAAVTQTESLNISANSWELDVWGRIRRSVESADSRTLASQADLAAARLSAHATLTTAYFQLRTADIQRSLIAAALEGNKRSLQLAKNRYAAGVATKADVVQAETQVRTTEVQLLDNGVQRGQVEHAIAVLLGKAPANFSIAAITDPTLAKLTPPSVPEILPSILLERRPDIAAAERRMAAANAQIGVARAAFFPTLTLSSSAGFRNSGIADLLSIANRSWSLGPTLALSLFDAGSRHAQSVSAMAAYDQTVASYRQTVLTAFQEVEDNLLIARVLAEEAKIQQEAADFARETLTITENQYRAGTVAYLNVITAQNSLLSAERSVADITNRRIAASMQLLKNAGGRWDTAAVASK